MQAVQCGKQFSQTPGFTSQYYPAGQIAEHCVLNYFNVYPGRHLLQELVFVQIEQWDKQF